MSSRTTARHTVAAIALLCAAPFAAPAVAAPTWVRVDSPNFTVVSDDGERAARNVAWQFEQVRAVLQRLWPWARLDTGRPILVFAVKNEAGVKGIVPEYWEQKGGLRPTSAFFGGPNCHYVVLRTDVGVSQRDVNPDRSSYWSYVSLVIDASFTRRPPPWFARGLSEVMSNTVVRTSDLTLGQIVPWTLRRLQSGRLTLEQLMTAGYDSKYLKDATWLELFDASSWALVHYLMFGEKGTNLSLFNQAVTAILFGGTVDQAVGYAFGGLPAVSLGYNKYASQSAFFYGRADIDIDVKRDGFAARVLTPAESAALRGSALAAQGRVADATALLTEARSTAPALGLAFELEGLLADRAGDTAAAKTAYGKASEADGAGYYSGYRLALLLWPENVADDRAGAFAKVVAPLEQSVAANGSFAHARSLLAQALLELERPADAWPHAQRATALAPAVSGFQLTAARVLFAMGKRAEAMTAVERAIALTSAGTDRDNAERFKAYMGPAVEQHAALARHCQAGDIAACTGVRPFLEQTCSGGDAQACYFLGLLHERGRGVERDARRAAVLYEQACAGGNDMACLAGGMLQWLGSGVPKDADAAIGRFGALCGKGLEQACVQYVAAVLARPTPEGTAAARVVLDGRCKAGMAKACELLAGLAK